MQLVLVCGGRGTRLFPRRVGPKSLVPLGGLSLLARLVGALDGVHTSAKPPIVVIDARDRETPAAIASLLPAARVVRQDRPDGVANALLLAEPFLDDVACAVLGDVFIDGSFAPFHHAPALLFWREAAAAETGKNFGISIDTAGAVRAVIEKPADPDGQKCGMGVYVLTRSTVAGFCRAPIDARTGERGITTAIQAAIDAGQMFAAVSFSGYYNNVNSPTDVAAVEQRLGQPVR
jgi:glucose-1-phosphate thymidylyltransferase